MEEGGCKEEGERLRRSYESTTPDTAGKGERIPWAPGTEGGY